MPTKNSESPWGMIGALAGIAGVVVTVIIGMTQCSPSSSESESGQSTASATETGTQSTRSFPGSTYIPSEPSTVVPPGGTQTSTRPSEVSTVPPAPPVPTQEFLADLDATDVTPSTGAASVNGQNFSHSIYGRIGGCREDVSFVYDIGRDWSSFSATVGVRDDSMTDSVVQFEVYADGALIASSGDVAYGQSRALNVSIAGALSLKLRYLFVDGDQGLCSNAGYAVWGDATPNK